ncbi:MAG: hypothetical protein NC417_04485 [Candidatus Gastranaerophilales bacterium]|nr:hypothetical protein [Candidatus Gastranaerophilales bacterium]
MGLSGSEMLFYGGLGAMAAAVALAVVCAVILSASGKKIKRKLEQEYGKRKSDK